MISSITKVNGVIISAKTYPIKSTGLISGKKSEMFYYNTITKRWNCSQKIVDEIEAFDKKEKTFIE